MNELEKELQITARILIMYWFIKDSRIIHNSALGLHTVVEFGGDSSGDDQGHLTFQVCPNQLLLHTRTWVSGSKNTAEL